MYPFFPAVAEPITRPCSYHFAIIVYKEPRREAKVTAQTTSKKAAILLRLSHLPSQYTARLYEIICSHPSKLLEQRKTPRQHKNVHLRRSRHRREDRPPESSSKGLIPSRPRCRMPTTHETIPPLPQDCPRSQLARVSRTEQELPQLSNGERIDGSGRDEESGLWGGTDCDGRCWEGSEEMIWSFDLEVNSTMGWIEAFAMRRWPGKDRSSILLADRTLR